MLTNDNEGVYRQDNHGWLFGWTGGTIFQACISTQAAEPDCNPLARSLSRAAPMKAEQLRVAPLLSVYDVSNHEAAEWF